MKAAHSNKQRAMASPIDAAKRALERKPGGNDPESPHKKQAGDEENDMKQMMKQMMGMMGKMETKMDGVPTKMDDFEAKVDGMTVKVDCAVKEALAAKEGVRSIEAKATEL